MSEQLSSVVSVQRFHWRLYSLTPRTELQVPVVELRVDPQRADPETVGGVSLVGAARTEGAATRHASVPVAMATGQRHRSNEFVPLIGPAPLARIQPALRVDGAARADNGE